MTRWLALFVALLGVTRPTASACADVVKIKLATMAPAGSAWDELLKEMQADWSRASGGRVELRISPEGLRATSRWSCRKWASTITKRLSSPPMASA